MIRPTQARLVLVAYIQPVGSFISKIQHYSAFGSSLQGGAALGSMVQHHVAKRSTVLFLGGGQCAAKRSIWQQSAALCSTMQQSAAFGSCRAWVGRLTTDHEANIRFMKHASNVSH